MSGEGTLSGGEVSLPVKPNTAGFGKKLGEGILAETGSLGDIGKTLGKKLLAGFAVVEIGTELVKGLADSVKTATDAQAATTQLQTTVKNAGFAYDDYAGKVEDAQVAGRKFGFTNQATTEALTQLTLGLKDPAKALSVLGVAQDLAVAKHMSLSDASLLVTKAMEGQTRPLKALGIDLPIVAGNAAAVAKAQTALSAAQQKVTDVLVKYPNAADSASKGHAQYMAATQKVTAAQDTLNSKQDAGSQILDALSQRLGGSAAAAADTFAGKQAAMSATVDNFKEAIGNDLLLVLDKLVNKFGGPVMKALDGFSGWLAGPGADAISTGITWIGKYSDILGPAAIAVGALSAAAFVLDVAMDANPIGAVVLAIEALVAITAVLGTNMFGVTKTIFDFENSIVVFAVGITKSIEDLFSGLVNGAIDAMNTLLGPTNAIRKALGMGAIVLPHVDYGAGAGAAAKFLTDMQSNADTQIFGQGGGWGGIQGIAGGAGAGKGGANSGATRALGDGGTVMPTPGGTLVRMSERGRAETVVDTASLNRAINQMGNGGQVVNIYETTNARATAMETIRVLNLRRA